MCINWDLINACIACGGILTTAIFSWVIWRSSKRQASIQIKLQKYQDLKSLYSNVSSLKMVIYDSMISILSDLDTLHLDKTSSQHLCESCIKRNEKVYKDALALSVDYKHYLDIEVYDLFYLFEYIDRIVNNLRDTKKQFNVGYISQHKDTELYHLQLCIKNKVLPFYESYNTEMYAKLKEFLTTSDSLDYTNDQIEVMIDACKKMLSINFNIYDLNGNFKMELDELIQLCKTFMLIFNSNLVIDLQFEEIRKYNDKYFVGKNNILKKIQNEIDKE